MDRSSAQIENMLQVIRSRLRETPDFRLPFAEIMELALYDPTYGYYTKPTPKLGKMGDFFTNTHVSDLFGRVLADYFLQYWETSKSFCSLQLVEVGGGDGRLMEQISCQFQRKKVSDLKVTIFSLEKSPYHRMQQRKRMKGVPYQVHWVDCLEQIPRAPFTIVYQHELIDAFPVHRLKWNSGKWQEIYVTERDGKLLEVEGEVSSKELVQYIDSISDELADGQQIEVNKKAKSWMQELAAWLESGMVWTLDYGGVSRELRSIRYLDGTIRFYGKHRHVSNPYQKLGEIDITAHVNFEDVKNWGEEVGLLTSFYGSQAKFLQEAGILSYTSPLYRNAMKQLMFGMGEHFKVLVQQK